MNTYTHDIPISDAVKLLENLKMVVVDTLDDYSFIQCDYGFSWLRADGSKTTVPIAADGMANYFSTETEAKASALAAEADSGSAITAYAIELLKAMGVSD